MSSVACVGRACTCVGDIYRCGVSACVALSVAGVLCFVCTLSVVCVGDVWCGVCMQPVHRVGGKTPQLGPHPPPPIWTQGHNEHRIVTCSIWLRGRKKQGDVQPRVAQLGMFFINKRRKEGRWLLSWAVACDRRAAKNPGLVKGLQMGSACLPRRIPAWGGRQRNAVP